MYVCVCVYVCVFTGLVAIVKLPLGLGLHCPLLHECEWKGILQSATVNLCAVLFRTLRYSSTTQESRNQSMMMHGMVVGGHFGREN
jgi:hypothetical protein